MIAAARLAPKWQRVATRFLPFADAATPELPLPRLLRLSLFQITCGMAAVLLTATLNRVMIVELHMPALLVAVMVSIPLLFAPARALIGFKSDNHRSALGWKRVPYIWFGTLMHFGGFAILPFALLVMSRGGGPAMSVRPARYSASCWLARAPPPSRRRGWPSPPISRRPKRAPVSFRCSTSCC